MTDATVSLNAADLFNLGTTYFSAQSSSQILKKTAALIKDANGNKECETMIDSTTDSEVEYAYCNSSPDIKTDLATFLTKFGDVQNSILVTSLTINFKAGEYATVSISGHNHATSAHVSGTTVGYANFASLVPSSAGFGVPTFAGVTLGSNATAISATMTFTMEHVDQIDNDGDHFVGKNITPRVELSVEYSGTPTTGQPVTSFTTDTYSVDPNSSNAAFDVWVYTGHAWADLAT